MQNHIYDLGLLGGRCSDIRIKAFGRIYHLHRLVLIQSGFFRAMLCGGYAEDLAASSAAEALSSNKGRQEASSTSPSLYHDAENDAVELHFDDPNISRAAFEYSIAKLYGDGPRLVLPFWSSPSSSHPFSPALTMRLTQSADLQLANLVIDKQSHPATPRFLLSLIATSIYLNIPSVTAQALTLVLCSVTPFNVTQHLRFAIGFGIEGNDIHRSASDEVMHDLDEWDWELEGPARTLEQVARPDPSSSTSFQAARPTSFERNDSAVSDDFDSDFSRKLSLASSSSGSRVASTSSPERLRDPLVGASTHGEKRAAKKTAGYQESEARGLVMQSNESVAPEYQYGLPADKIGEACVCWYAQWGYDTLELECSMERERIIEIETWIRMCREDRDIARLTVLRDRLHTGDVDLLHTSMLPRGRMPEPNERMPSPRLRVWSYPSMPSSWVRAIISSDGFYVPSELHRYEFAKKVVEFRRKQKALISLLDRLIEDWLREDESQATKPENESGDKSTKMGGDLNASVASSDAGDGFGFKAFRRTASVSEDDSGANRTPLQEAWHDTVESTSFSPSVDEDEVEYEELFSSGIYYSHMPFQALNKISSDISPTTGRSYTPLNILQAALWVSNELKTHIMSSAPAGRQSAPPAGGPEAEAASEAASNASSDPAAQDSDGAGELGISSSITEFRDAFESFIATSRRSSRSRSGTPFNNDADATLGLGPDSGLGGLAASPLMMGSQGGGKSGLLGKKFYLVPSDDTVRFGDGLMSVVGSTMPTVSGASRGLGTDDERATAPTALGDDRLGPSGIAAIQIPHTLPIPTVNHQDYANSSYQRRDRSHYYGIANDVVTGRELGEYVYRHHPPASDTSLQMPPSPAGRHFESHDTRRGSLGAHFHDPNEDGDGADAASVDSNGGSPERWSGYEPMRVGAEFFGIDKLQEKQRLYSPTFFYAGSVWNLYVQVVKKAKGIQLGVYLHRQSLMEQLPPPSAPTAVEGESDSDMSAPPFWSAESTRARSSELNTSGMNTPRGRPQDTANVARVGRVAQQPSAGHSSIFAAPSIDDAGAGEGGASFFDTSFNSPVRANAQSLAAGSSLTLPSGRTVTRMLGQDDGSLMRDVGTFADTSGAPGSSHGGGLGSLADFAVASSVFGPSASDSAVQGESRPSRASTSQQAPHSARTPVIPLYPGGPSVYQTCPLPAIPYRDPRKELRAYFSIHCPSPLGTALTKFSSGPDKFTISQSWGWKSSSLLGTVHLENGDLESGKSGFWYRFRCVCTIGVV